MQGSNAAVAAFRFTTLVTFLSFVSFTDGHAGDRAVNGKNSPPVIKGIPASGVIADERYRFTPRASDADGDRLRFRVVNLPPWASFDRRTGKIAGTPGESDVGIYGDIRIRVTDGTASARLKPFSIEVSKQNSAPVITGQPSTEAIANQFYRFKPTASDADGDALRFKVSNLPDWARFDSSTGKLAGMPSDADVGVYEDIRIRVTDGTERSSLGPFSIAVVHTTTGSVTLSWTAPRRRTDGSRLDDLAGYRIYYGTRSGNYDQVLDITNPGLVTAVIDNLTPGTWYFAATALDAAGLESDLSNEARDAID